MSDAAKYSLLSALLWTLPLYAADVPEPPPFWEYKPPAASPPARAVSSTRAKPTAPPPARAVSSTRAKPTAPPPAPSVPSRQVIEPEMVAIPAGTFTMGCKEGRDDVEGGCDGDEKPAHEVSISAFKMAKTEVTFDQWDACEKAKACPHAEDEGWGRGQRPVINVSWDDVQTYIKWLNSKTGKRYRLPTEAEWEYAARGGRDGAYPWGQQAAEGCRHANMADRKAKEEYPRWSVVACNDGYTYTAPVGSFAANGYGLHDMQGNVWEWCQDWFDDYPFWSVFWSTSDPQGAGSGTSRVLRGGSWDANARFVRSALRNYGTPGNRFNDLGFRLVLPEVK